MERPLRNGGCWNCCARGKRKALTLIPRTLHAERIAMESHSGRRSRSVTRVSPEQLAGADIQKLGRVPTGTRYPILLRFEAAGWLNSQWENIDPKEAGRPRRRFYQLTRIGFARANEALRDLGNEVPVWA
jgi:hypothetical protein